MTQFAFEAAGEFDGATTALSDGSLVNIAERLANNDGRIDTNDPALADALRSHPAVREIDPSKAAPAKSAAKGGKES